MSHRVNLISFGELHFCIKNQQFFKGEHEVRAEPKVCELLTYLYQNRDRYVSLPELHEALWCGRVVSDTAVRRTISKLRSLLADEASADGCIRSLSKRGYKLVIDGLSDKNQDVNECPTGVDVFGQPDVVAIDVRQQATEAVSDIVPVTKNTASSVLFTNRWMTFYLLLLLLAVLVLAALVPTFSDNAETIQLNSDKIQTFVLSQDKRFIVYAADLTGLDGYQLFLKDLNSGFVQQLTRGRKKYIAAAFTEQGNTLLYISWDYKNYQLSQIDIQNAAAVDMESNLLLEQSLPITNLYVGDQADIFLTLYSSLQTAAIYQFDRNSLTTKAVTFPRDTGTYDEFPLLNHKTDTLYYIRTQASGNPILMAQDYQNGKTLKQVTLPKGRLRDLQWYDEDELLLLYTDQILVAKLASGKLKRLDNTAENTTYLKLQSWHNNKFLLLENTAMQRQFYLHQQAGKAPLLNIPEMVYSVKFTHSEDKLLLCSRDTAGSMLSVLDKQTGKESLLMKTQGIINDLAISPDGNNVHLSIDKRLAIFNQETASLYFITNEAQQVAGLGEFSHDNSFLLYGEKFGGRWRIVKHDLATQQSSVWMEDYVRVKRMPQGYALQGIEGRLFQLKSTNGKPEPLAVAPLDLYEEFQLRYPLVYQRQVRDGHYQLAAFNLLNGQETIVESQTLVSFDFSVDNRFFITQRISYQSSLRNISLSH
ncbi:MAG: winged helix-turn-helix domain-containing protein [Gammaproteobacteria bacterium]|nr:winged helix-turn-helix domain-containing protein [Gammaproteobacteria bacterium]MBU1554201.1 winged helix-turn-helix domain-containing protein [Gammaproteobacteria bacterium]MBU2070536.1 winged helix-turn-helix domain-containing protein [Gammaproteobacteria bacterium]MBU2185348.1 winged helix-turn-helix domain-containing protein [Gammaproteobacteria bacterium]